MERKNEEGLGERERGGDREKKKEREKEGREGRIPYLTLNLLSFLFLKVLLLEDIVLLLQCLIPLPPSDSQSL